MILDLLHGDIPALNGVTLRTVCAHPSLVHVGMTVLAIPPDIREHRLHVALRAFHFFVHTAQRISGLVVIEFRIRLDRAPRAHLVAIVARDGERRPMRIARSRPVLLMDTLGSLGGLPTRCRRAPHRGEGQQGTQNDLEQCRRKIPPSRAGISFPRWEGAVEVASTLCCLTWQGNCTDGQFWTRRTLLRGGSETMAEGPSAASESRNHAKVRIRNDCRVFFVFALSSIEAARVVVGAAIATVDHADSRASEPPNRNPSGAASD